MAEGVKIAVDTIITDSHLQQVPVMQIVLPL